MNLNWSFQKGWGVQTKKNPMWREYGYFLENHILPFYTDFSRPSLTLTFLEVVVFPSVTRNLRENV